MHRVLAFLAALVVASALGSAAAKAQNRPPPPVGPAELYFLAVGSADYPGFPRPLLSAEGSAALVADALLAAGARHGILLMSRLFEEQTGRTVTRADIRHAVEDLKARIRADGAVAPRIVVYMMGHGFGDANSQYLFFMPGDMPAGEVARTRAESELSESAGIPKSAGS